MLRKTFGDLVLPAIGQGAGGHSDDREHRVRVLQAGIDRGMTLIDTAEVYQCGESEAIVGQAIRGRREQVVVATKFSPHHHRRTDVAKSLEGSLRRLQSDYVDLYQVHWPNPAVPIEETMGALADARSAGKVRHIGVSNFPLRDLVGARRATTAPVSSNQVEYNLFERGPEEDLLPYCETNQVAVITYNPLLRGRKGQQSLATLADRYGVTPAQIILNWQISHPAVVPIPMTLNLAHLAENAAAADFALTDDDRAEIDRVFAPVVVDVPTDRIRVVPSDQEPVYITLEDARANALGTEPSPEKLAADIRDHQLLKPVRLKVAGDGSGPYMYDLVQGRMRYWAWIIAFGPDVPIPAYIFD